MAKIFPKDWQRPRDDIHMISLNEIQRMYQLDINKGLSRAQVKSLQERYGRNQIELSYSKLIQSIFLGLTDYFSIILWVSLVFFVLLFQPLGGDSPDAKNLINVGLIILTFLIKSLFIALQEYKLIKLMKSLQSMNTAPVTVLRDSEWKKIPASELSVGDLVEISTNERVPADMRLISVKHLHLDKSILTGNL
jgi:magnesium-transporting ATPase (P-type)